VVLAGELDADGPDAAVATDAARRPLTSFPGLGALGGGREEEMRQALAGSRFHPIVVGLDSIDRNFDSGH
jgi:hypothetical protein